MFSHRDAGVTGISSQVLPASENNEAIGVRMCVSRRQTPVWEFFYQFRRVMALTWTTLKRESRGISRPVTTAENNIMILEMMGIRLLVNGNHFGARVVPNEGPEVFCVNLFDAFQPLSETLTLAAFEPLR